jgi:DNA-3-methyladenine glycosylase
MKSTGAEAPLTSSAQVRSQQRLGRSFYERPVVQVARELIGCTVAHGDTAGIIVETEAYHDSEPASHAFVGLTARTSTLFGPPGNAYVYRSYGIHALLNAVCEPVGVGAAVLIRALHPISGLLEMRKRRSVGSDLELCSGPGKLTQALDVELHQNGSSLLDGPIAIFAAAGVKSIEVLSGPRVGITKAVDLPWRFCLAGSPYVSRPRLS